MVNDLKTAVSEACNNVVVHAYDGVAGPLRVDVAAQGDGLAATVRDRGIGFDAVAVHDDATGVGLAVMSALAAKAEFATASDGGAEVRMWFPVEPELTRPLAHFNRLNYVEPAPSDGQADRQSADSLGPAFELWGDLRVTVSPVSLTAHVLGRLARALAATARFSFDRFSDVYLIADAVGAHAQRAAVSDQIAFSLTGSPKRIELSVGPFRTGTCAALQRRPDTEQESESPLWLLADQIKFDGDGRSETLRVVMHDRDARARDPRDPRDPRDRASRATRAVTDARPSKRG